MGSNTRNLYNLKNGANKLAEINIAKDMIDGMVESLQLVVDSRVHTVGDNILDVNIVADNIEDVNTIADNISEVQTTANNIGAVVGLYENYDEIVTASTNVDVNVTGVINVAPTVVGTSTNIGPNQNAISFCTEVEVPSGVEITIYDDSMWSIY